MDDLFQPELSQEEKLIT